MALYTYWQDMYTSKRSTISRTLWRFFSAFRFLLFGMGRSRWIHCRTLSL